MRTLRISLLVALACCAALWAAFAPAAVARVSTYKGQFQCDDRGTVTPLAGMTVELWERGSPDFLPVEIVGHRVDQDFTDAEGRFAMTTEDNNDNYFVRMALRDAHGVHLRDFWGINDWSVDTGARRNDVPVQDYGGMVFSNPGQSHKCAIWAGVHGAHERYRSEVGTDLAPFGVEIQADAITGGTPFTPGTSILWPGGYPVGYRGGGDDTITRHEFGHVIRHGFDGDLGHFFGDVVTYGYAREHTQCLHSNAGYAFNEGWAEFWAPDFEPAPPCDRPGDMETEGNVAAALTELMENCAGGRKRPMVENLQRNPGTIHSFNEFRDRLGCPFPKLFPVTVVAVELAPPKPPPPADPALRAAIAAGEVRATGKRIKGLTKALDVALDKADRAPATCTGKACDIVLKTVTRPAVLEFERDVARIHLRTVDDFDTAKEQTKLAGTDLKKLLDGEHARELADQRKTVKAALGGVEDAIGEVRPYLKGPGSGEAKGVLIGLNKAASKFRKALRKGSKGLPSSLTVSPYSVKAPRRVNVIPPPPPFNPPTASVRTITTLTLNCPALVASPKPFEVSGSLTPGQAGSAVKVSFQFGAAAPVFVTATTDAAGNWSASYTPSPNDTGTWTVSAAYGGDSTRTASNSPPCKISYA
jgi:hypothetical protein